MALWYVRSGGSILNAGSTDTDVASQSGAAGIVVVATMTEVGAFAAAAATGVVNLQDAGVSVIRTYVKVNDDSITLDSAPPGGDATYAWKIGGARALPNQAANSGAGNNVKIASGDTVYVQGAATPTNYVGLLVLTTTGTIRGNGGLWSVDGTGGGAGSDTIVMGHAGVSNIYDCVSVSAVDIGFSRTNGTGVLARCRAQGSGGIGFVPTGFTMEFCSTRACATGASGVTSAVRNSEFGDNTGGGLAGTTLATVSGCLIYDNGAIGLAMTTGAVRIIEGNTIEGNTGDGIDFSLTSSLSAGSVIKNNIITNNAIGVDSSAGAQTAADGILVDYNLFSGNSTARVNFPTGANDTAVDPGYTAVASDDYSPLSTGGAYKTGYSPFKNPTLNTLNKGAVAGTGSTETFIYTSAQTGGSRAHRR